MTGETRNREAENREVGDRLECNRCGAVLVYEKPCPCSGANEHKEICCGVQMEVKEKESREPQERNPLFGKEYGH